MKWSIKWMLLQFSFLCLFSCAFASSFIAPYQLVTCQSCHGTTGISANPTWPNLSGQHQAYLLKQLQNIKQGQTRNVPVMQGILAPLSETDLAAMAAYYSTQPISIGTTPKKYVKRGEQLYRGGDFSKQITACIACHGPGGEGNGQAGFPVVSGQHAAYTVQQLQAFKSGVRKNDLNAIMRDIAQHLSDEDMQALAYYMQGLYPTERLQKCCTQR